MSTTGVAVSPVVETKRGLRPASLAWRTITYVLVVVGAIVYSMPFVWMLSTSVKPGYQVYKIPPEWIPDVWNWVNYVIPWQNMPFYKYYLNSITVAGTSIVLTLITSSLVAFGFARMRFRGRDFIFMLVLSTMMLPVQVTWIPIYILWSRLGLVNTLVPLIVPSLFGGAFNIFLLRQYMMTVPLEYDDAARIDGASWFQIYYRLMLPMSAPALGVIAIFAFTHHWNDFVWPLIILNDSNNFTIPLGLMLLNSRYVQEIQQTMAQTILAIIPVLVLFFTAQRFYIQGIVISGVKG